MFISSWAVYYAHGVSTIPGIRERRSSPAVLGSVVHVHSCVFASPVPLSGRTVSGHALLLSLRCAGPLAQRARLALSCPPRVHLHAPSQRHCIRGPAMYQPALLPARVAAGSRPPMRLFLEACRAHVPRLIPPWHMVVLARPRCATTLRRFPRGQTTPGPAHGSATGGRLPNHSNAVRALPRWTSCFTGVV